MKSFGALSCSKLNRKRDRVQRSITQTHVFRENVQMKKLDQGPTLFKKAYILENLQYFFSHDILFFDKDTSF